jgi:hypothetical protein
MVSQMIATTRNGNTLRQIARQRSSPGAGEASAVAAIKALSCMAGILLDAVLIGFERPASQV